MKWLNRLLGREPDGIPSTGDTEEIVRAQREADRLRAEAEELLEDAQCHAELMRETRREDHYIDIIDALFRGEAHAND